MHTYSIKCPINSKKISMTSDHATLRPRDIIDVDSFEYEDTLTTSNAMSANFCKGHTLTFPHGKSPHSCYPFALHDTIILPWDYVVRNGIMTLFARKCTTSTNRGTQTCRPCQQLINDTTLEGILTRIEDGVHPNAQFAYHGISGLQDMLSDPH